MGYYIQVPHNTDKATQIEQLYDGMVIPKPTSFSNVPKDKALIICVVNPRWDAAAFAFDEAEFVRFTCPAPQGWDEDTRPRIFLLIDRDLAIRLSGFKEEARHGVSAA